jgi:hypothetical protein
MYPQASNYFALLRDSKGHERFVPLSNGQANAGSGAVIKIVPLQKVGFPAAMEPLKAGRYTLVSIIGASAMAWPGKPGRPNGDWPAMLASTGQQIEVKEGPSAGGKLEEDLVARVRARDAFSEHVAFSFGNGVAPVVQAMLQDLQSSNPETVTQAANQLARLRDYLPGGLGPAIERSTKQLISEPLSEGPRPQTAFFSLCELAWREGSDASLNAVITCLNYPEYPHQEELLHSLKFFKQSRAKELLRSFLKESRLSWRIAAAYALAETRDPQALDVMLDYLEDPANKEREMVFYRIEYYWNDPRVLPVIEKYLQAPEERLSSAAMSAQREVRRQLDLNRSRGQNIAR